MVKITQTLLIAALIAGPALALGEELSRYAFPVSNWPIEYPTNLPLNTSRDVNPAEGGTDLFAREFTPFASLSPREVEVLLERSPNIFGKIFGGIKKVAGKIFGREIEDINDLTEREVEELCEREPRMAGAVQGARRHAKKRGGRGGKGGKGRGRRHKGKGNKGLQAASGEAAGAGAEAASGAAAEPVEARAILAAVEPEFDEREVEELLQRSPIFRKIFRGVKRIGGALLGRDIEDLDDLDARDLVELDVRAPIFGKIFRGAKRIVGGLFGRDVEEDLGDITARDIVELYEREPIFGKIFRGIKKVGGAIFGRDLDIAEFAELAERGFPKLDELTTRDLSYELYGRGRRSGKGRGGKGRRGRGRKGKGRKGLQAAGGAGAEASAGAAAEPVEARAILAAVEPEFEEREVEELLERSPIFRKIFRGVKRIGGALLGRDIEDVDELSARDLVELDVRAPIFGKIFRGAKRIVGGLFGRDEEGEDFGDITARDIIELYEREPIFDKIFRGVKKVGGAIFGRDIDIEEFAQIVERDFHQLDELTTRELSDEIYERGRRSGRPNRDKFNNGNSMFFRNVDPIDDLEAREPLFWYDKDLLPVTIVHILISSIGLTGSQPRQSARSLAKSQVTSAPLKIGKIWNPATSTMRTSFWRAGVCSASRSDLQAGVACFRKSTLVEVLASNLTFIVLLFWI